MTPLDRPGDQRAPLTAGDVMTRSFSTVEAGSSLLAAWRSMGQTHLRLLVVVEDHTCLGVVELHDLWVAWATALQPVREASLHRWVSPAPCVAADAQLAAVCKALTASRHEAVLVTGEHGDLIGLITAGDVLRRLADDPDAPG
ncbi:MAG: hypothetical protein JWL64_2785 [Frankiales bacterium]|nr:hypothetical protein [Frankiales bacterium]